MPKAKELIGDRGYDADWFRQALNAISSDGINRAVEYERQMNGSHGLGSERPPYKHQDQFRLLLRQLNEMDQPMTRKYFLAACALVFITTAAASVASAEVNVDLNLNLGGGYPSYYPEPYPVYPSYPVTDDNYDDYDNADCGYEYIRSKSGTGITTATELCTKEFGSVIRTRLLKKIPKLFAV